MKSNRFYMGITSFHERPDGRGDWLATIRRSAIQSRGAAITRGESAACNAIVLVTGKPTSQVHMSPCGANLSPVRPQTQTGSQLVFGCAGQSLTGKWMHSSRNRQPHTTTARQMQLAVLNGYISDKICKSPKSPRKPELTDED